MNVYRLLGDLAHIFAVTLLLQKIWCSKSCAGISGKSQILFAIVSTTRYLDLFISYISLYNSIVKVFYILCSYFTLYLIYVKFRNTYNQNQDTFRIEILIVPVFILAMIINHEFTFVEVLWTFSIYLEAVAILPQLFIISKTREAEDIIFKYLIALGSYRALYIVNWIYRYNTEGFYDLIVISSGVVQTLLFCDFFCNLICINQFRDEPQYTSLKPVKVADDEILKNLSAVAEKGDFMQDIPYKQKKNKNISDGSEGQEFGTRRNDSVGVHSAVNTSFDIKTESELDVLKFTGTDS